MTNRTPDIRKIMGYVVRWLLPLALTVVLVSYMFRKVDFSTMWQIVTHGVDYWWILLAMGISVFSHVFRALRWQIQLRSLGITPPFMALVCSIFGTYALNLVFPRLGEIWRCTYIARSERKPFNEVLGSMVADRLADTVMVLLLTCAVFVLATPAIEAFLAKYPVGQDTLSLARNPRLWIGLAGCTVIVWSVFRFGNNHKTVRKTRRWLSDLWHGFAAVASMKGKGAFTAYSFCIWGCYFLQLYVAFYAFPFTRRLCTEPSLAFGLTPCLVAFVLSSVGMAIPSNGGLGPWNIAVMFGLAVYGINDAQGTAFSMLQWSGQTVMLIILGIYTMAWISLHKQQPADAQATDDTGNRGQHPSLQQ